MSLLNALKQFTKGSLCPLIAKTPHNRDVLIAKIPTQRDSVDTEGMEENFLGTYACNMQLSNVGITSFCLLRRHMIRLIEFGAETHESAIKIELWISV
jgi:hypothetical protein